MENCHTASHPYTVHQITYEFVTIQLCISFIGKVSRQFMHGLMENAIYGGRVDNIYDMRVLQSYLVQLFDSKLLTGEVRT